MKPRTMICLSFLFGCAVPALGQSDDELRARELIARITKEMSRIDELLLEVDEATPKQVQESLNEVQQNIEELLKNVQAQQAGVIENIEELVRLTKYTQSNQGQGSGDQEQQGEGEQPKNRQREKDAEPKDLKYQGDPKDQKPESGEEDRSEPEQNRTGQKPPPSETEKFQREDVSGRWGNLPPKVAEMFMNLSPDQFPPKYRQLLEQYYKKANDQKK